MAQEDEGDVLLEATEVLTFRDRGGNRLRSEHMGRIVLLGREFPKSAEVNHGETWRCFLLPKDGITGALWIAEPIEQILPTPSPPRAAPAPVPVIEAPAAITLPAPLAPPAAIAPTPDSAPVAPVTIEKNPEEETPVHQGPMHLQEMLIEPRNVIRNGERVAFFIDAAKIGYAARDLGFRIDWKKALEYFLADGTFAGEFFHVADRGDLTDLPRVEALAHMGYTVRRKPVKVITDRKTGERRFKANVDMELAVDMINVEKLYDVAYLFSGDSDFERLIDLLRSRGKRVFVVSSHDTLSLELSLIADKPLFHMENFRQFIERRGSRPPAGSNA